MFKDIVFEGDAREKILKGVQTLARAVKSTLGPSGKNVMIARSFVDPVVTKDGVTVANSIELRDHLENAGAQMVKVVSAKTATDAGDGTTTATVLAEAIYAEGQKAVVAGESPLGIKRGIEQGVKAVVQKLQEMKIEIQDRKMIEQIGTIASNNDTQVGQLLAEAMEKVGKDGVISIEEGGSPETSINYSEGLQFDKGYISPYMGIGQHRNFKIELQNVRILLHEERIDNIGLWQDFLTRVAALNEPILIICSDMGDVALKTIIMNNQRDILKAAVVKAPGFGQRRKDILGDIAALTGGTAILSEYGLTPDQYTTEMLGKCNRVVITQDSTMMVGQHSDSDAVKERISAIREELEYTTSEFDREKLQERLAKLTGGVARIFVGGRTEAEMKEKKDRIEDALHATRAAVEEGVLPGGGAALARCIKVLDELETQVLDYERVGVRILRSALSSPIKQIAVNAGQSGDVVLRQTLEASQKDSFGYNALKNTFEDLFEAGIIDPVKVTRCALENAASVATLLLTTDVMVVENPKESEEMLRGAMEQGM